MKLRTGSNSIGNDLAAATQRPVSAAARELCLSGLGAEKLNFSKKTRGRLSCLVGRRAPSMC